MATNANKRKHAKDHEVANSAKLTAGLVAVTLGFTALGTGVAVAATGTPTTAPAPGSSTAPRTQTPPRDTHSNNTPAPTSTTIDQVKLPEYAGAIAHNFFEDELDNANANEKYKNFVLSNETVKQALTNAGIDLSQITVEANTSALKNSTGDHSASYGPGRQEKAGDVIVTLKDGNKSNTIKVKGFYYQPPYAQVKPNEGMPSEYTNHNAGKLNVKDPDNISLTNDQKTKLINDFIKVNNQLGIEKSQLSMANDGTLTITGKNNEWKATVPKTDFISVIAEIPDLLVFKDPNKNASVSLNKPFIVDLMNGEKIYNPVGNNGIGVINRDQLNGLKLEYKEHEGKLYVTGSLNRSDGGTSRYLKVWSGNQIPAGKYTSSTLTYNYLSSWSNKFNIRQLFPKSKTIIRCVDIENKRITKDELEKSLSVEVKKIRYSSDTDQSIKKLSEKINSSLTRQWNRGSSTDGLKHEVGRQDFTGKLVTPQGNESADITATAIYYTEKITDTLVKDPKNLTPEEINTIKDKVKKANSALKLVDNDIIVDKDGTVTLKIKDPNSKEKDGKTSVKFQAPVPMVKASYADKIVEAGKTVKSPIAPTKAGNNAYKFPSGTTFAKPNNAPNGISVDPQTGEVSYTAPADAQDNSVVTGTINVTLPGETTPTAVAYKITVQQVSKAKLKYVILAGGKSVEIETKFHMDGQEYPSEIEGKRDAQVIEKVNETGFSAPKFVGYKYKNPQVNGQKQTFSPNKDATLELVYEKLDEIIPAENGKQAPEGYVAVTFKDAEGAKVDDEDKDKVFYVNPKAVVKIENGKLVGKNAKGEPQEVAVPTVSADKQHLVKYHKSSEGQATTWAYNNYDKVGQAITDATEFKAQTEKIVDPVATEVQNKNALTETEKDAVKKAIKDKNPNLPTNATITVNANGHTTITVGSGNKATTIAEFAPDKTIYTVKDPTKTFVKDPANLTTDEQAAVKKAVEDANKDEKGNSTLPQGLVISVDEKGNVSIKDGEGESAKELTKLTPDKTVYEIKTPAVTEVENKTDLTKAEQDAVKKAVEDANKKDGKSTLPSDAEITVDAQGNVTIKQGEKELTKFGPEVTVKEALHDPEVTEVVNKTKLTETEKNAVIEKVKTSNPHLPKDAKITVAGNGTVTIKDKNDKELGTIPSEVTVKEALHNPDKTYVADPTALTSAEKDAIKTAVKTSNPNLPTDVTVEVGNDGTVTIKSKDNKELGKFTPVQTVFTVQNPEKTKVTDTSKLTKDEKTAVKNKVTAKNPNLPQGVTVEVANDGTVTIKQGHTTLKTISGTETVYQDPAAPTVTAKDDGSVTVTVPTDQHATKVTVTYTAEDGTPKTITATKGNDGKWSIDDQAKIDGITIDDNGVITIPENKVKDKTDVTAKATDAEGHKSSESKDTAKGKTVTPENPGAPESPSQPEAPTTPENSGSSETPSAPSAALPAPVLDPVAPNAGVITGTATPGAKVTITLPNGTTVTTTAHKDGSFSVAVPEGVTLKAGDTLTARASHDGKSSDESQVKVRTTENDAPRTHKEIARTGVNSTNVFFAAVATAIASAVGAAVSAALRKFRR